MTDKIIPFPCRGGEDGGLTLDQWHECLFRLHQRLSKALLKERKQVDAIRMVLSIDDVMDLCQTIEDEIGPDWFGDAQISEE